MAIPLHRLDHLVLTVSDIDRTVAFYESMLGMEKIVFGDGRVALGFGEQKINLHVAGNEYQPCAGQPTPGSADLCFITDMDIDAAMTEVQQAGVPVIAGPLQRTGALGPILSFYFRDPDQNLIEVARQLSAM